MHFAIQHTNTGRHGERSSATFFPSLSSSKMATNFLCIFLLDFEWKNCVSVEIVGQSWEIFFFHCCWSSEEFFNFKFSHCWYFAMLISINTSFIFTTLAWFRCIHYAYRDIAYFIFTQSSYLRSTETRLSFKTHLLGYGCMLETCVFTS